MVPSLVEIKKIKHKIVIGLANFLSDTKVMKMRYKYFD